jgi:putative NADH-flavin reductase
MRLLVLGATGRTGQEVLTQALQQGHDVTALVRDADKLEADHKRLDVRVGDVTEDAAIEEALVGQDAVLSTLGARGVGELFGTNLITRTAEALVPSMEAGNVRRLIFLSALGVGESAAYAARVQRIVMGTLLRQISQDKAAGEDLIRRSKLDWTLVYPPSLSNGPLTEDYRAGKDLRVKATAKISRADVADFMLGQLDDASYTGAQAILS